jgi:hypothetical protein
MNPHTETNRIGRFHIPLDIVRNDHEKVAKFMRDTEAVVIDAKVRYDTNTVEYLALSPCFPESLKHVTAPEFEPVLDPPDRFVPKGSEREQEPKLPDGWIPHKAGDPMPCESWVKIQIQCRDGYECDCRADDCNWEEVGISTITHWRPVKPEPKLPDGVPPPPEGFEYWGKGPLVERAHSPEAAEDVARITCMDAFTWSGWCTGFWGNMRGGAHYALRKGTELHRLNFEAKRKGGEA